MAAAPSSSPEGLASKVATKRLQRDLATLQKSPNPQIQVRPSEANILEWHFVLHSLPNDTPYASGCYHGKIHFPPNYPHAPPSILMVTPSGRLEVNKRLCLSMTDFHPESWNPAWSVETILVGLLSFFVSDQETGYGSVHQSEERRRQLAGESWAMNARDAEFLELFPEYAKPPDDLAVAEGTAGAEPQSPLARAAGGEASAPPEQPGDAADASPARAAVAAPSAGGNAPEVQAPESADVETGEAQAAPAGATRESGTAQGFTTTAGGADAAALSGGERLDGQDRAQRRSLSGSSQDEEARECWICRETTSEALIHPCACRGTMSGVHASCVEQWIAHHRRNAVNAEAPRCSVCHEPYSGQERRPGLGGFLRYICCSAAQHVVRTLVLVALLVAYQVAATGPSTGMPLGFRVSFIAIFSVAALYKVVVLTVSLPMNRAPPQLRWTHRFFIADYRQLAMHIAEAFATITILAFWCICRVLSPVYFLPFLVIGFVPLARAIQGWQPSLHCLRTVALAILVCLSAPLLIVGVVLTLIYRHPGRVVHPLDAGLHIIVAITVVPFCLLCVSNVPVVILLISHSVLVAAGLTDLLCIRRLQWKEGVTWWFALQLTALSTYVANTLCEFPKGFGEPRNTNTVVVCTSTAWLCLFCGLALGVNRALIVRYFRTWQQRHGHFTLQVPGSGQGGGGQVAPTGGQDEPLQPPV